LKKRKPSESLPDVSSGQSVWTLTLIFFSFWADQTRTQLLQARTQDTLNSLSAAIDHAQHELSVLARTNVYNDAFCIGHDGVFGTVNGLRLGRVSGVNVEWAEINAAWGQTLLLLYTIARKLEFTFETCVQQFVVWFARAIGAESSPTGRYRLIPMGSFSRIEKISGDKGTYELSVSYPIMPYISMSPHALSVVKIRFRRYPSNANTAQSSVRLRHGGVPGLSPPTHGAC
jgi:Apg6 BARA domain